MDHSSKRVMTSDLSLFDLLFLLLQEGCGDAGDVLLCAQQQRPQVLHELAGVLAVQEPRQVDLHHLTVRVLQHTHTHTTQEGEEKREGGKDTPVNTVRGNPLAGRAEVLSATCLFYPHSLLKLQLSCCSTIFSPWGMELFQNVEILHSIDYCRWSIFSFMLVLVPQYVTVYGQHWLTVLNSNPLDFMLSFRPKAES